MKALLPSKVHHKALLKAVHSELLRPERSGGPLAEQTPRTIVGPQATVFRAFDQEYFVVEMNRQILRRDHADKALIIRDEVSDQNRFTGQSHHPAIAAWGGLYCSLQQQATVNEVAYYVEKERQKRAAGEGKPVPDPLPRAATLHTKCVLKINLLGPFIAADLSSHNSYARPFVDSIERHPAVKNALNLAFGRKSLWDAIFDPDDYSAARGLGLALAAFGFRSLIVQTARQSERSSLEDGDNMIFFGHQNQRIANLSPVEAYLFPLAGRGLDDVNFVPGTVYPSQILRYPVEF